jgi:hypothetical protein
LCRGGVVVVSEELLDFGGDLGECHVGS